MSAEHPALIRAAAAPAFVGPPDASLSAKGGRAGAALHGHNASSGEERRGATSRDEPVVAYGTRNLHEFRWYACLTRSRSEKRVRDRLTEREVESYLPLVAVKRKWSDRQRLVQFPLFPGYVFARFRLAELHRVLAVPGLASVVRLGAKPAALSDDEIENIRRIADGFSAVGKRPDAPRPFLRGTVVRVKAGPFKGVRGVVIEDRGQRCLLAGLQTLDLALSIEFDNTILERIRP